MADDEEDEGPKIVYGTWEPIPREEGDPVGGEKTEDGLLPIGEGKATYPNRGEDGKPIGDVYTGTMENGKRSRTGNYKWAYIPASADEEPPEEIPKMGEYTGEYQNHKRHGKGTYVYPKGDKYEGYWENGLKHGTGLIKYSNGDYYQGEWAEGKKEGKGLMRYINGDWYKGTWKAGQQSGRGVHYFKQHSAWFVGEWANGEFVNGDWKLKDGSVYRGKFQGNKSVAGSGMYILKNGITQTGKWYPKQVADGTTQMVWVGDALAP